MVLRELQLQRAHTALQRRDVDNCCDVPMVGVTWVRGS